VNKLKEHVSSPGISCIICFVKHNKRSITYNSSHHCYAKTNKQYAFLQQTNTVLYIKGPTSMILKKINSFKIISGVKITEVKFLDK
jgi:hypothetical protein